jgi:hypothetical protein
MRVARVLAVVVLAGFGVTACVKPPPPPPPVTLADLNSSFSGTQSFEFGTHGCSFVFQIFEADYRHPNVLKEIELHIEGCVSDDIRTYTGTFLIDTDAGTVSGTTFGFVIGGAAEFEFNLAVESATGQFRGTTGNVHASIQWSGGNPSPITGSLTAV